MEFVNGLRLLDAVVLLKDRVDELFEAEEIPQATYTRKSSFRQLLRAINKADRMICNVRKKIQTVALYLPKEINLFPLAHHDVYAGQQIAGVLKSTLVEKHPSAIEMFIDEQPWVEIAGIESEYAYVYEQHLTHTVACTRQIKRVNLTNAEIGAQRGCVFTYDTERRLLHLSRPFAEDVFLVFQARIRPGKINIAKYACGTVDEAESTELKDAMVRTPDHLEDVLLMTAMSKLMPVQADTITEQDILVLTSGQEDANGPSFIEPGQQYAYFGEW